MASNTGTSQKGWCFQYSPHAFMRTKHQIKPPKIKQPSSDVVCCQNKMEHSHCTSADCEAKIKQPSHPSSYSHSTYWALQRETPVWLFLHDSVQFSVRDKLLWFINRCAPLLFRPATKYCLLYGINILPVAKFQYHAC